MLKAHPGPSFLRYLSRLLLPSSLLLPAFLSSQAFSYPELPLMLPKHYQQQDNISDYWVSEKLDGVRAYWDGSQLMTRRGTVIQAPSWFIQALPKVALDGELWLGRGKFDQLSGIIRSQNINEQHWRGVHYMLFDLPNSLTPFDQRQKDIKQLCQTLNLPWLRPVEQYKISDKQSLNIHLQKLSRLGAEGLMLHKGSALHQIGRSEDVLKYKLYQDAEAVVLGYTRGNGQFTGQMGALIVRLENGRELKIGSGFNRQERENPPPIGSTITYRYNGNTNSGLPRFARFIRIREE